MHGTDDQIAEIIDQVDIHVFLATCQIETGLFLQLLARCDWLKRRHLFFFLVLKTGARRASTSRAREPTAHKSYGEPMKFSKSLALIFGLLLVAGAAVPGA